LVLNLAQKAPLRGGCLRFCWKISRGLKFCFWK
jgi:hypothetical protein